MKRLLLLSILLVLSACAGVKPEPPPAAAVNAPAAWRTDAEAGVAVSADWWSNFNDPMLTRIVEQALANNVDIAIAAARVEEARAQFRLARGAEMPSVAAIAAGDRDRSVDPFLQPLIQNEGEALLTVSYDVDLFGRLSSATEAARASILATEAGRRSVQLAVAAGAASGYINLRALDARLLVLKDTLAVRAESLRIARRRAEVGYSTNLEREQAEAEFHGTEQQIPITELAITRQEDGLSLLLGDNPRAIERGQVLSMINIPQINAGLPSGLLSRRPDILQAAQQIVVADKSLDAARAAFMPSFQLSADIGYVASSLLNDPVRVFSIGGSLLAPIFEGGRLHAQADSAAARRDQAAFAYRKTALNAFREVDDALVLVQRTAEQERFMVQQRGALERALVQATKRYKGGYSPYIEQLDAQRGLLATELALVQARADELNGVVSLYQALGGGWKTEPSNK